MEPRSAKKKNPYNKASRLSPALIDERLDKPASSFWDGLVNLFLFLLGGVILCAMLYGILMFT
ncbi:hypothetical protein [Planomicrobium sp. YIM 101495]|uniref:hypothetical protein n=1 Tax=Planomicrobium sp. YIM 101495 TaxID=2665160 RepID=UPI0012B933C0|nr:hypothetical protein [Planomicrobium sp. YIM 101495]MTD29746.1 hypothetical protein [Planomicrobium sp. YIM 101495]